MKKFILLLAAAVVAGFSLQAKTADEFRMKITIPNNYPAVDTTSVGDENATGGRFFIDFCGTGSV